MYWSECRDTRKPPRNAGYANTSVTTAYTVVAMRASRHATPGGEDAATVTGVSRRGVADRVLLMSRKTSDWRLGTGEHISG